MLRPTGPMSNNERQRRFRAANPGYFKKYRFSMRAAHAAAAANATIAAAKAQSAAATEAARPDSTREAGDEGRDGRGPSIVEAIAAFAA